MPSSLGKFPRSWASTKKKKKEDPYILSRFRIISLALPNVLTIADDYYSLNYQLL